MSETATAVAPTRAFSTGRRDAWWAGWLVTAILLLAFVVYSTFRVFDGIFWGTGVHADLNWWHQTTLQSHGVHYLSPFFSPQFYHWFGWSPIPLVSGALLVLWAPAGFRTTCYYYRKAYYRAWFQNPPGCAVGSPWPSYKGERFLLVWQNLHRYTLYVAIFILIFLWWDAILGFVWAVDSKDPSKGVTFGMGVGSLVLLLNAVLLSLYTFSCHCWRHLIGGGLNCFANKDGTLKLRYHIWKRSSWLNERHMLFAWTSLIWVGFSDIYVTLVARGVWTDLRFF